ncbi:MAG: EamA family transporter [Polymorphobacter sp.]
MTARAFGWRPLLLGLAVMVVWGSNFTVIKLALDVLPPLLFATLRFTFALVPLVFFLPRPPVPWRNLAAYGVLIGLGQFGMLFIAINGHIAAGLASLVVQCQVFFTIALSMWLASERLLRVQWLALAFAVGGIGIIAWHGDTTTTPLGLGLVLVAAASWGCGNIVQRRSGATNMLAYVVWASLFSVPPLLVLSLLLEGPAMIASSLQAATPAIWAAVLWQSVGNTLFGYGAWGWLLGRYPTATVAPLSLLVPVFGMGFAAWILHEPLPAWKLAAAALVLGGLGINIIGQQFAARRAAAR